MHQHQTVLRRFDAWNALGNHAHRVPHAFVIANNVLGFEAGGVLRRHAQRATDLLGA